MKRRVYNLLCIPQIRSHLLRLAGFVCNDGLLGLFEAMLADEERPGYCLAISCSIGPSSPHIFSQAHIASGASEQWLLTAIAESTSQL